jgi:hypothetical protein
MKKAFILYLSGMFLTIVCLSSLPAFGFEGSDLIEPTVDVDFISLRKNQSKTVTADLSFPLDFEVIPVALVGSGNLSMSLSRTNTQGELVYMAFYGFGVPTTGINVGITPVSLRLSSTISEERGWGFGIIVHGILFSLEEPPYEYSISLSF